MEPAATGSISVEGPMANEILEGGGMGGWGEELVDESSQWAITIQHAAASIWKHW